MLGVIRRTPSSATDEINSLLSIVTDEPFIWTDTSTAGGFRQGEVYSLPSPLLIFRILYFQFVMIVEMKPDPTHSNS